MILVAGKLHSRWRLYNGLCVAAQKYVNFTAVSGSELLAGNNNFTVFTISNENTEKRHIFYFNQWPLFSYLDKKSIYILDECKNLPVDICYLTSIWNYIFLKLFSMMVYVFCFINKNQWEFDDRISMQLHGTYIIILIYNENVLLDPIQIDGFPADVLRKTCLFILIFKFKVTWLT